MDCYDIIKTKFFKGRKPKQTYIDDWLEDENTPFFLKSPGSPFLSLDLTHLSEAMGVDVTSYSYRRIVSTWALSHPLEEIRNAETEALQHSLKIAHNDYVQNKQLKPQKLTQTYLQEECLIPESVRSEIRKTELQVKSTILETEGKRQKKQNDNLIKGKEAKKQLQQLNKPLGARHRILEDDRIHFEELMETMTGERIEDKLKQWKPLILRNLTICLYYGEIGEELRNIWTNIYRGDLKWGVRDARNRAQEKNWPRREGNAYLQNNDRNSWIAYSLLKSFQVKARQKAKKSALELMK